MQPGSFEPQHLVGLNRPLWGSQQLKIRGLWYHLGGNMSRAVTVSGGPSGLRQVISVGRHQLIADEPKASGGHDEGPDPYELLLSALGSCTNMTLRMYADRKGVATPRDSGRLDTFEELRQGLR
jgi:OsmC-like protein